MIAVTNKIFIAFSAALLFAAAGCYAYWQHTVFLIAPLGFIIAAILIHYPEYLFYFLLASIPWSVEYSFSSSLSTDLPDEPLMLLAAGFSLCYLIYRRKNIQRLRLHPLLFVVVLQFIWAAFTVSISTDAIVSIKYLAAKTWYLLAFLILPIALFRNEKVLRRSFTVLLISMLLLMCISLVRHAEYNFSFEKINNALKPFFRNHVNYSALLVFMVPIQIATIRLSSSRTIKTALSCVLIVTIAALYFSYARGAWLALIIGLLAYWLLQQRLLLFSYLLFFSIALASLFWLRSNDRFMQFSNDYRTTIFHKNFKEHLVATYKLKDLSNAERLYRWVAAVRMFEDSWATGFGPSTFYDNYKSYTLPAFKTYVSDNPEHSTVHNYFLLLLVEQGVIGCLLFLLLVATFFAYAQSIYHKTKDKFWRTTVVAAASVMAMQCVVNFLSDMIETDKAGSIFYLCVAVVVVADVNIRKLNSSANVKSIS